ncbi:ABC transporter permease [Propionibacterium australiense]|uniref:P-loop containing nucleoside triphosphate hydrolase n=1 Tax=Propionibacterium australiense TaxID=119981 RepID=A0A383S651_9ACTN|nr:ABC transporter permease [Propionibacterium australiense]SYZ33191.1 P-loop containing nucleoside triphosphate hydrolase [Propionibacterium australiense]VEH89359.1 Iron import ATP-binding/permease protein IrtA [Propionibacterium australiense]
MEALRALVGVRAVLVIAHRLETIACADQLCLLEDGRLAERGPAR